ncbi:MAG TPA: hypothetical protein VGE72_28130 [Azospirillum sp.]
MISPVHASGQEAESALLERLRGDYEGRGFTFTANPTGELIPDFLAPYRPDAIARKPGENVAIEVLHRSSSSTNRAIASVRKRFAGHPEWKLDVVYVQGDQSATASIPRAERSRVRKQFDEVADLSAQGHNRAAFILAWSLLEAALNSLAGESVNRARSVGQVVQWLAMSGYVGPDTERRLRELAELRNRIVHGDLGADATPQDVARVLEAIEEVLASEAA